MDYHCSAFKLGYIYILLFTALKQLMLEKEAELALTNNELVELEEYQVNGLPLVDQGYSKLSLVSSRKKVIHTLFSRNSPQTI